MTGRNLLILMSDEHTRSVIGAYGNPLARIPALDRPAAGGMRFDNAYTPSSICISARASFATGLPVYEHRCWSSAEPYYGKPRSWMHRLRERAFPAARTAGVLRSLSRHGIPTALRSRSVDAPASSGDRRNARFLKLRRLFDAGNLRAWLAVRGEIATNRGFQQLHRRRYTRYKARIEAALRMLADGQGRNIDADRVARQLSALIDGLWLEYCLYPGEFTLAMARNDCHHLPRSQGIPI